MNVTFNSGECRIVVLDDWQNAARDTPGWDELRDRATVEFFHIPFANEDDAARQLAPFDIILAMRERTAFPASLVRRLPRLRMFGLTGSRAALVDMESMLDRGITVCHTETGRAHEATAELALALILAAARDVPYASNALRSGAFQRGTTPGILLAGKTLGVLGLGRTGARMAVYGKALGMQVLAWSQNMTAAQAEDAGAVLVSKEELLEKSDVVSVHLVLSERTLGVIGRRELAMMKRGAILVNTSRSRLIDEVALIEAVREERIIAALDVFDWEPLAADHPLTTYRNVILTPHIGYSTREIFATFYEQQIQNTLAYLSDKPIRMMRRTID